MSIVYALVLASCLECNTTMVAVYDDLTRCVIAASESRKGGAVAYCEEIQEESIP